MEERRIGVYVCHCGVNIEATVDTAAVAQFASKLPGVVVARDYIFMCSDPGQELIRKDIKEYNLNGVVVAACSPRLHEPTFRRVCESAGLNQFLFEMANIREHCSWVHQDREKATQKAKEIVAAAVAKVRRNEPLEVKSVPFTPAVVVVGGGIAGIQASLEIANAGYKVYLVEREPSIGGHMIQLDKTFPTLDCSACILTPKMSEVGSHPNIELFTWSEVEEVSGYIGNFKVKIRKKARFVDEKKCTGCGVCEEKCPFKVDSEFDLGLKKRKVIYRPFPQAVPNVPVIDKEHCVYIQSEGKKCGACLKFCEPKAIDFSQKDEIIEVDAGAIILATGYDLLDPARIPQYGYGKYDNVITALQFERLSNATGPTGGEIVLKDGRKPESVAIIHCVGSRDENYHEYCSRVCCMYALKHAHLLKEKLPGVEVFEFYIDMRCFGEGYEEFYKRLSEEGVNFIRGKVSKVVEDPETKKLVVFAADTLSGKVFRVPVDMVILCPAMEPKADAEEVARLFSIGRKADGFFLERHPKLDPVATPTDGILVAGCCQSPKDIPDTVAQASAAAARVLSLIGQGKVILEPTVAWVNEEICSGCRTCESLCSFGAVKVVEKDGRRVAEVNEALCKGCGACGAACPSGAMSLRHFKDDQLMAELEALLAPVS